MTPTDLETLLKDLEDVTEQAFKLGGTETSLEADFAQCLSLLERRNMLIRRLSGGAAEFALSYTDYNRLVIVGFQGQRLQENLLRLRMQLAAAVAANRQQSTYAERVLGCFPTETRAQHSETA